MSTSKKIAEKLFALPSSPGVYLMKDEGGSVLYVGKSAALRNRVRSYFHTLPKRAAKIRRLVDEIADFEIIQTSNEAEAFILEDTLIKRHHPRYNIRLRDDKRYPYIKITNEPYPRVMIVRRRQNDGARYFGPHTNVKAMRATLKLARKLFPIRTCKLDLPLKTPRRPCLNYHIGRCLAPCAELITGEDYAEIVNGSAMLFEGRISGLLRKLKERMGKASGERLFEKAAGIRDQIRALEKKRK